MSANLVDVLLTLFTAAGVLGLAGTGVLALPWRDREVAASWDAWRLVGAAPAAAVGALRSPARMVEAPADALLPPALPRPCRERSRARRLGHVALHDGERVARAVVRVPSEGAAGVRLLREATPAPLL